MLLLPPDLLRAVPQRLLVVAHAVGARTALPAPGVVAPGYHATMFGAVAV